jgi:ubiquinone biosynthesis protein Coq4
MTSIRSEMILIVMKVWVVQFKSITSVKNLWKIARVPCFIKMIYNMLLKNSWLNEIFQERLSFNEKCNLPIIGFPIIGNQFNSIL